MKKTLLLILICSSLLLAGNPDFLKYQQWNTILLYPTKFPLYNWSTGELGFDFPIGEDYGFSFNYLYHAFTPKTIPSSAITVDLSVLTTGNPQFNYVFEAGNTCVSPATTRPFFWANKDDPYGEYSRWWANPDSYILQGGSVRLVIPLTPDRWSSVYGKFGNYDADSLAGFNNALANISSVGLTFGGGCFFGHGVNVSGGTAQFVLHGYEVN